MQTPPGGELPGVALPPPAPAKSSNTLVVSLVAVIAILVVALIFALVRPWDNGTDPSPGTAASSSATTSSDPDSSQNDDAGTANPSEDQLQRQETVIAKEKGWVAGEDFIPIQPQSGRDLIESIPSQSEGSGWALGPEDAPVVVHLFADFSCPMCTKLHLESMPELEKLARDGQIHIQWHNFVIFPEYGSDKAARGAVAAAHQGKLWEYVDAAFNTAEPNGHPVYTDESVLEIARTAGIPDIDGFKVDYSAQATADRLDEEAILASETLALSGTPALFINGSYLAGAYPLDTILNTIEVQTELANG